MRRVCEIVNQQCDRHTVVNEVGRSASSTTREGRPGGWQRPCCDEKNR